MLKFVFDKRKNQSNLEKHGIDFIDAQLLWDDPNRLEIPAKNVLDEPRYLMLGMIENKCWSAVVTYRGESIRIISVRRSRKEEVVLYESERF